MKLNKAQREQVRLKFGGKCAYCGCDLTDRWHADHLEPVLREWWGAKKGQMYLPERDNLENLMPSCPPCNIDKHAMSLESWRVKLQQALGVLSRNHATYRHALRFGLLQETPQPIIFYFERLALKAEAA